MLTLSTPSPSSSATYPSSLTSLNPFSHSPAPTTLLSLQLTTTAGPTNHQGMNHTHTLPAPLSTPYLLHYLHITCSTIHTLPAPLSTPYLLHYPHLTCSTILTLPAPISSPYLLHYPHLTCSTILTLPAPLSKVHLGMHHH